MNMDILFNPEKHGYKQCEHCGGYGSSLKESNPRCSKCDGTGLVKKENKKENER